MREANASGPIRASRPGWQRWPLEWLPTAIPFSAGSCLGSSHVGKQTSAYTFERPTSEKEQRAHGDEARRATQFIDDVGKIENANSESKGGDSQIDAFAAFFVESPADQAE